MIIADRKKAALEIVKRLAREYPDAKCHLDFTTPFELLISTILAAQCTDVRVNLVMRPLYKTLYKKPADVIEDGEENFRNNIKSINFFSNKAKFVLSMCRDLVEKYKGKVPSTMEELVTLKGVGRKTANVVLGNCFGKNDVIIVDTHLKRVATRLGLTDAEEPDKIEAELKEIIPSKDQFNFSMRIGELGRQICKAKNPMCGECFMNDICPSSNL